jgi:DNA-binding NarL/FixJ family response regulator
MSENQIRILLADDHAVLRAGLRVLLNSERDMAVVGEASDGAETLQQIDLMRPDVVVLDLTMPGMSGLDIIDHITTYYPTEDVQGYPAHTYQQTTLTPSAVPPAPPPTIDPRTKPPTLTF